MKLATLSIIFTLFFVSAFAQSADTQIETISNYNDWGWTSVVMTNGLITVATMPDIGARIMQYDLGSHASIFVNPSMIGKVDTPNQNGAWLNYGGYKVWPAPQDRWSWIPPVQLDTGVYESQIVDQTSDSVSVYVKSPPEVWRKHNMLPGLVFERRAVVYKGTSRVKLEQSMINTTSAEMTWSVWDVTQAIVHHEGERDFENFWVYFPIKTQGSLFGEKGVKTSKSSSAWVGEVAPGVFGVQFQPNDAKIFADSPEGWIAYVDEREGYAYFKVFEIWEGETYPDDGARNEVWVAANPLYLEVEVVSPIWPIPPNNGKITFVENWYAARMFGPIKYANNVGAINKFLAYQGETARLGAIYGVFYEGAARVVFLDENGGVLAEGKSYDVSPMNEFTVDETLQQPEGATTVQVRMYDNNGEMLGTLESKPVDLLTSVSEKTKRPITCALVQNYPNPFNPSTTIAYSLDQAQHVMLTIYDVNGRKVETLVDGISTTGDFHVVWDASAYAAGIYLARLDGEGGTATTKMILLK
ncbi:T9SS C-terminal target domain-containing protein [candidate division KSB1 bacterium]|nr:T9SS type A sorting domain-containing protein [candidate division KSB1 bacterium]RQW03744.1 MAG: T9SS C-terminal target domain-containing protein [candidate division KSB1 bacterium]